MGGRGGPEEPTLHEAWAMLGERMGLVVEETGKRSVRAHGQVRGRAVNVEIDGGGSGAGREFARSFFGVNTFGSRNRREKWHTVLSVGCANPAGATGTITSAVDTDDPAWDPRAYDPRNGRHVVAQPPGLAERAVTPEVRDRLMSIIAEVTIEVQAHEVRLDHRNTAIPGKGANYVAGSVAHHYQGTAPPWPERALVGPPWWIDLLCDIADGIDGAPGRS
jgi:hypothetical protein